MQKAVFPISKTEQRCLVIPEAHHFFWVVFLQDFLLFNM